MAKRTSVSNFEKHLSPSDIPNPFSKWASENEPHLKEFFVRGPLFGVLFSDDTELETRFIFGPSGSGKTAYRRMLERRYRPQNRSSTILAANYSELTAWSRVESSPKTGLSHWHLLKSAALLALVRDLLVDPQPFFALFAPRRAQLAKFFQEIFPSYQPLALANWLRQREQEYLALADAIEAQDSQYAVRLQKQWELLEALRADTGAELPEGEMEQLRQLLMLAERCGLTQTCVFVDGVEKHLEQNKSQDALQLILPLCHSLQILDELHLAIQFFLPQELETPLRDHGVRFDRYKRYELNWTNEQLTELLRQRLENVSEGKISSMGQLAEEHAPDEKYREPLPFRLDRELVIRAHGSPRQLIRLASALFDAYYNRAPREGLFIEDDLNVALATEEVPQLLIDEQRGRVSIGDREIEMTAKELKCLILLKHAGGETMSRDEIWKKLYPHQMTAPSPEQTDSFFSRLRKKLERDPKHPVYLITERARGFHLENVAG